MDVSHPLRSVIPSLDGPVLEVLAGTTYPLSTLQVHRLAGTGSPNGVRLVLERLAEHGLVTPDHRGNAIYYSANRDHLAWPAVEILAGLRAALRARLADELSGWASPVLHASLFGSAARGDGGAESDIDILLVRRDEPDAKEAIWDDQVSWLRDHVVALTGNRCQLFDITLARLGQHVRAGDPLVDSWRQDGILLAGVDLDVVLTSVDDLVVA
jgi:DNA-binding transcriptional ArsR family regulator